MLVSFVSFLLEAWVWATVGSLVLLSLLVAAQSVAARAFVGPPRTAAPVIPTSAELVPVPEPRGVIRPPELVSH